MASPHHAEASFWCPDYGATCLGHDAWHLPPTYSASTAVNFQGESRVGGWVWVKNRTFAGHHPEVLAKLPAYLRSQLPVTLTHRGAITWQMREQMLRDVGSGRSFSSGAQAWSRLEALMERCAVFCDVFCTVLVVLVVAAQVIVSDTRCVTSQMITSNMHV